MMVKIKTRAATVNIAFSSSRNAVLTEREKNAVHKIVYKTPSLYIERIKTPKFLRCHTFLLVFQHIARIRKNTQTRSY